jgi:hypothetical protein
MAANSGSIDYDDIEQARSNHKNRKTVSEVSLKKYKPFSA